MKFVLDAEQRLFGETLHKLLTETGTPALIRRWAAGDPDRTLWSALAEAGVFALAVPERHDGAGPLPVELVVAVHELGRHAVPGPIVETLAAAALIDTTGAEALSAEWLPRIAAGEAVISLAPGPRRALDADAADLILLTGDEELWTAVPDGAILPSLDPARRLFPVTARERLAAGPAVPRATAAAYDLGVLACSAQLLGLGRALLDTTVEYARTRRQFGRPIGEFQAVKHHLADAALRLEFARPCVHRAAWVLKNDPESVQVAVSLAKAQASDAALLVARKALQVHGAIGYTVEYDLHMWMKRAWALAAAWGDAAWHRDRVKDALLSRTAV
jgi:alkylation response protein AidB-like acyl-CoA dehydrogenase